MHEIKHAHLRRGAMTGLESPAAPRWCLSPSPQLCRTDIAHPHTLGVRVILILLGRLDSAIFANFCFYYVNGKCYWPWD